MAASPQNAPQGEPAAAAGDDPKGSIVLGMVWMALISLLLFWLPVIGPVLAGVVGGKQAGGVLRGILAAILPSLLFGVLLFVFATALTGLPLFGAVAAAGGAVAALMQVGPLLAGAIVGGLLA